MENIENTLKSYFPDIYFTTSVLQSGEITTLSVQNEQSKLCLEMVINANAPDVLTIKQIKKCNIKIDEPGSGTYILSCIENIAHDLKIKKIVIDTDVSSINIECGKKDFSFSLKYLFLFSTGKTWYGKHGFNLQYNSENFYKDMQKFISQEFISSGQSNTSEQSILVKDYFENMRKNLKHEKNCVIIQKYYNDLQKYIRLWKTEFNYKDDGPYIKKGGKKSKKLRIKKSKKSKKFTRSS
jgi:hypothetical protein